MLTWGDTDRAWQAIEWCLVRASDVGPALNESGNLRALFYAGARSIDQPDIEIIYEVQLHAIVIHSAVFSNAKAPNAGRA